MKKIDVSKPITLQKFEGGPGWDDDMQGYIGITIYPGKYTLDLENERIRMPGIPYTWATYGVTQESSIKKNSPVLVSNNKVNWINNDYIYVKEDSGLHIVKNEERHTAFKFVKELKEDELRVKF